MQDAMGMSKDEFYGLPAWKQTQLRKEAGLFWKQKHSKTFSFRLNNNGRPNDLWYVQCIYCDTISTDRKLQRNKFWHK